MSTSTMIRAVRPVLSALAVMLAAGTLTAQAATVTSTVHYQKQIVFDNCSGNSCYVSFPAVPLKHQLNITRMSCYVEGSAGSTFNLGQIVLANAHDTQLLNEYLPGGSSASNGYHTLNQAVDVQVAATQHIVTYMVLASGTVTTGSCAATGTLDTLE